MNRQTLILLLFLQILPSALSAQEQTFAVVAPLSGPFASYGEPIAQGTALAEKALKQRGEYVRIVLEDACLPADAVRSAKRLVSLEKIDAIVGSYCVIGLEAMLPVLSRSNVPVFHTSVLPSSMLGRNSASLFSTNTSIEFEASYLSKVAYEQLSYRKVGIIYFNSQWGESYSDSFSEKFESLGGTISGIENTFVGDDKSTLRSSILRLSQKNPDALFVVSIGSDAGAILKHARSMGMTFPFLSVNEIEDKNMLDTAGSAAEGLIFATHSSGINTGYTEFTNSYVAAYSKEPHPLARHAYDATMQMSSALNECQKNRTCLLKKLFGEMDGASGRYNIGETGVSERKLSLKTVKDGKFIPFVPHPK